MYVYGQTANPSAARIPYWRAGDGFSFIELLVRISYFVLLAALLLTVFLRANMASRNAHCKNNTRQLGLELTMYTDEYHAYPFWADFSAQHLWFDSIAPYYAMNKKVMNCAAFHGVGDVDRAVIWFSSASFFFR